MKGSCFIDRFAYPNYEFPEDGIIIRPYKEKLLEYTKANCKQIVKEENPKECMLSFMPAFDCINRSRVSRFGDNYDNYSYCAGYIDEGKEQFRQKYSNKLDKNESEKACNSFSDLCHSLSISIKPFI